MLKQCLAWCVHGYTALGLVAAAAMAVAIDEGSPASYRFVFFLMFLATLVDATDGTLARAIKIKEVLPHFDGRRLDDLVDFQTYTTLPLYLIWRADLLPADWHVVLLLPLLASAYGFCQTFAKTDDGYFLGFPSYWNIIAFYLYVLHPPAWFSLALVVFFALLTFVPARYLYPTQRGRINLLTNQLGAVWAVLLVVVVWRLPTERDNVIDVTTRQLALASLLFPAYYLGVSWYVSLRLWRRGSLPSSRQPHPAAKEIP